MVSLLIIHDTWSCRHMVVSTEQYRRQVTVVTITRRRPAMLRRAIEFVANQCCDHVAAHLVLVDDCRDTWIELSHTESG